ncbi:hypothetical protein M422DRAFT_264333 [Sphaerobolus stellatus SS14]|uniref:Uncharacterized protein n=1 Tax=Sphaerobolus stellatus (strain SS14) TaxID=990650 RepID=A0A0C9V8D9_SPHS4|nr:hypothetical protein M422DRAFT_264333 [Sphaerobolus stellatus SS14]
MVGLWNLTQVDASFAKAATNTPRLFNVGTLADYGAVSAEYPIDRASVIQMRYRMAYNLIFEIVRGNIQFPENSDAYAANGTFHARINQIINLYRDAKQSSYGVRDELRASIQTVKALLPIAKEKMSAYVNAKTTYSVTKVLQSRVAKQRPSNACNLTLLTMHLIKCIVTNPREDSFTRFVLQDLNFQPSSQRFGIFFIPTLHRQTLAVYQMEQDDDPVIQHVTSTRGKRKQCQKDPSEDPRRTEEYPLGTHPSWHEITDILDTNPTLIINTPSNLQFSQSANGQIHHIVIQLLCKWAHNYTCTINPIFLTEPENYPQPETWQDILNFWTINQIQDTFHAPAFLPHKSHWKGLPKGSKQLSFGERFRSFFPPLETEFSASPVWHILKAIGYLKDYHTFLSTKPEHDILSLQDGLQAAFDLLECLPDKVAGINTQPWKHDPYKEGPSFIVNAKAYKMSGVGPPKKNTNTPCPRAIATHTRIEALLLADNLNLNFNDAIKHIKGNNQQAQNQAKHSAKHRNKRKPPQKIQKSQGGSANQTQEIQLEHLEEDGIQEEEEGEEEGGEESSNHYYLPKVFGDN